ncbi:hypothetical protein Tdes44962_MAKER01651 [Teratosphaeria destructans]|uniref:Uncharacterized protein n=1 Tax=Teratosphaeria destructans TaxID=418781 RepID=A0A9W7SXL1_9PEZI|nr:hypothetical protein Tdes44962_MAKER01651 [Teratosphaeria destructans]
MFDALSALARAISIPKVGQCQGQGHGRPEEVAFQRPQALLPVQQGKPRATDREIVHGMLSLKMQDSSAATKGMSKK